MDEADDASVENPEAEGHSENTEKSWAIAIDERGPRAPGYSEAMAYERKSSSDHRRYRKDCDDGHRKWNT